MPDVSLCANQSCQIKHKCYRSEASGTVPSFWQSYSSFSPEVLDKPETCKYYWPLESELKGK